MVQVMGSIGYRGWAVDTITVRGGPIIFEIVLWTTIICFAFFEVY
jgi:hypothetical protein